MNVYTTGTHGSSVPLTTLWPTFLAVCTLLFATFFAVLTGPASVVPMEMASARMIENNAFMVLNYSFLRVQCAYPTGKVNLEVKKIVEPRRGVPENFRGWACQDSNLGPRDYESPALTAELQAQLPMKNGNALVARANAGESCRAL